MSKNDIRHAMYPWSKYEGLQAPGLCSTGLDDIIHNIGGDFLEVLKGDMSSLPKPVADRIKDKIGLAMLSEDERKQSAENLLAATEALHVGVLELKHGRLVFPEIVSSCRVYGGVSQIGMEDGVKVAIDNIKNHAKKEAAAAASAAVKEQAPAMYDVTYKDAVGEEHTEKVMTTAVYVLTEDEMVELEKAITERVKLNLKSD